MSSEEVLTEADIVAHRDADVLWTLSASTECLRAAVVFIKAENIVFTYERMQFEQERGSRLDVANVSMCILLLTTLPSAMVQSKNIWSWKYPHPILFFSTKTTVTSCPRVPNPRRALTSGSAPWYFWSAADWTSDSTMFRPINSISRRSTSLNTSLGSVCCVSTCLANRDITLWKDAYIYSIIWPHHSTIICSHAYLLHNVASLIISVQHDHIQNWGTQWPIIIATQNYHICILCTIWLHRIHKHCTIMPLLNQCTTNTDLLSISVIAHCHPEFLHGVTCNPARRTPLWWMAVRQSRGNIVFLQRFGTLGVPKQEVMVEWLRDNFCCGFHDSTLDFKLLSWIWCFSVRFRTLIWTKCFCLDFHNRLL